MTLQENYKIKQAYIKMLSESIDGDATDHALHGDDKPAVWIGTYGNYNAGSLDGEGKASGWVDLTTFGSGEEFREWLDEQSGGKDVEWMFQDYMNFPRDFYGESSIDDGLWDYIEFIDGSNQYGLTEEQLDAVIEEVGWERAKEALDEGAVKVYSDCHTLGDVAQDMLSQYTKPDGTIETYVNPRSKIKYIGPFPDSYYEDAFDYEKYGRESSWDWSESEHDGQTIYEAFGVSEDDDKSLGEAMIEEYYGGIEGLDDEELLRYVDFEELGRYLGNNGTWIDVGNDKIEIDDF